MDSSEPTIPDERFWISYSRQWALPISALTSPILHIAVIVLIVALTFVKSEDDDLITFEPVVLAQESPGGGNNGLDNGTRAGLPQAADQIRSLDEETQPLVPGVATEPLPMMKRKPSNEVASKQDDAAFDESINRKFAAPRPMQSLKPILKGLPDGSSNAKGTAGRGAGKGSGTGPGTGPGDGAVGGQMSQKQKRQLRWTLLFNIKSARNYLDQLSRMNAIIGVQFPDKSIKLVRDLNRRPAVLEGSRPPDRIFWMDDNPDAVNSISQELGISQKPWRIIAFFPTSIEEELLRKEHAYGQRFGRETEDQILETVFRVEDSYGIISITVSSQEGKK